jgi:hypothetical protein
MRKTLAKWTSGASTTDRKFTVLDAMVMLMFTAAGLALSRFVYAGLSILYPRDLLETIHGARWGVALILPVPCVFLWTLGLIVLRMRLPRPSRRRVLRQPGFVANLGVLIGSVVGALPFAVPSWSWHRFSAIGLATMSAEVIGASVASALAILALSGRWKSERSWLDRAGRALAIYWIIVGILCAYRI